MTNTMISLPVDRVSAILTTKVKTTVAGDIITLLLQEMNKLNSEQFVFNFGKHKGKTLVDVNREHHDYLIWLAKQLDGETEKFQDIKELLKNYV